MKKDDLGNRMKEKYEDRYRMYLTARTPAIIRIDGKAFHTFTKNMKKPYSWPLADAMKNATIALMEKIQGAKIAYTQSDEISIFISDYTKFTSEGWFDYNVQKITSVSASIATLYFNSCLTENDEYKGESMALFDSRVFNIPKEEVANYFLWRQIDWRRNSIQLLAQSMFSHSELYKKNTKDLLEMCKEKGIDWNNDIHSRWKNGLFIYKNKDNKLEASIGMNFPEARGIINEIVNRVEE